MTFDFSDRSLEDATRINTMHEAWQAYHGSFTAPLHNRPRRHSDAVIVNRCKPVADKAVAALSGRGIDFQVADEQSEGVQDWIDACLRANKKMAFLQKLFITGAVCGHLFIKIVPAQPYPRLVILDPASVLVEHKPDDVDAILCYHICYSATDGNGQTTEYRQTIARDGTGWLITDQTKVGSMWQTTDTNRWPYPFSPIVDAQNLPNPNSFWGMPDLTPDLIQINKQLNLIYSNINRILKYNASPKNWVSGIANSKLTFAPDETIVLPQGAAMGMLEMKSDLASSLEYARRLETAMDVLSRTPSLALGDLQDVPRGQVTGPSLELMLEPLIEKTGAKQALIGDMLTEMCRRLLFIAGFGADIEVFVRWPEIIPSDPLSTAQVAQIYQGLGVSKETLFARLGLSWEQERQNLAREALPDETVTDVPLTDTTNESPSDPNEAVTNETFERPQLAA